LPERVTGRCSFPCSLSLYISLSTVDFLSPLSLLPLLFDTVVVLSWPLLDGLLLLKCE
jgi:hypothetical protein